MQNTLEVAVKVQGPLVKCARGQRQDGHGSPITINNNESDNIIIIIVMMIYNKYCRIGKMSSLELFYSIYGHSRKDLNSDIIHFYVMIPFNTHAVVNGDNHSNITSYDGT